MKKESTVNVQNEWATNKCLFKCRSFLDAITVLEDPGTQRTNTRDYSNSADLCKILVHRSVLPGRSFFEIREISTSATDVLHIKFLSAIYSCAEANNISWLRLFMILVFKVNL